MVSVLFVKFIEVVTAEPKVTPTPIPIKIKIQLIFVRSFSGNFSQHVEWLTKTGAGVGSVSAQLSEGRTDRNILEEGSSAACIHSGIGIDGGGGRSESAVAMMVVVDGSSGAGGWMDTVAVVRVDRRAVVVVVRMDRAVRRMRMRITRVGKRRMRRVGMVSKGVHGMVRMTRMTRMTRMVRVVSVVNSMRMVTAVVVMVMMARMRAQIGSCGSGSGTVRQAEEVGQVLPPMLHAHRAHKRHAHLKKK